ncbi:unnamed protein product [Closterium sp. NIES-65]|nr:unnamed protein product [Closterium sp. NIES-65]CAI6009582.1 unnamed protein product [Closterium sp. NIES-65]
MVGGVPAACLATQSGSGREEDGWREQKASSVSSELRPTRHQGGLQGGQTFPLICALSPHSKTFLVPPVSSPNPVPSHSGGVLQMSGLQLLQCVWDYASLPSLPFSLPPPGLPHSGAALQVSGVQLLHCMWGHTSVSSPPFSLPPPGLPHSGGALQLP